MAYRLSFDDDVQSGVRLVAREQLAGAAERIERADEDPVTAVHEARKHLKKTRALLRLARPALGTRAYRAENDALREIALALSGTRDADVLVATVAALAEHAAGRLPADLYAQLQDALAAEADAARGAAGNGAARHTTVLEALRAAELRVETWPLAHAEWDDLLAGAARAYARGRAAFVVARAEPTPELLHAWRKRAKDLWYHQRLLAPAWPELLGAQAEAAHALSELLGDDHDLAVLAQRLTASAPLPPAVDAEREELLALVAQRSGELRAAATQLGLRLYAESPRRFSRRLASYVRTALAERRTAADSVPPA